MSTTKDERIYIRIAADVKEDFETLARFKGLKTATFLHSLIVKTIHEARIENPTIFKNARRDISGAANSPLPNKPNDITSKSERVKGDDAPKTFTTADGSIIPLYDETATPDEDEEI